MDRPQEHDSEDDEEGEEGVSTDITSVKFSPENEVLLKIKKGENLTIDKPWTTAPKEHVIKVLASIGRLGAAKKLRNYGFPEVLIGYEATNLQSDAGHLVCITEKGRDKVLGELGSLHTNLADRVRRYLNRSATVKTKFKEHAASTVKRPPITYEWTGLIEARPSKVSFGSVEMEPFYNRILSRNKDSIKLVECAIQHKHVLATPDVKDATVQTEPEVSINDCSQFIPEVDLPSFIKLTSEEEKKLAHVCLNYKDTVLEATDYNTLFDLYKDDYSELLSIGTPLTVSRLTMYKHYMSFTDISQFEGKILTSISWHPTMPGAAAASYGIKSSNRYVTLESDSDEENYVSRGDEVELWAKSKNITSVADQDSRERDEWIKSCARIENLMSLEYSESRWESAEMALDAMEKAMKIRDFEIRALKIREDEVPPIDAETEEFNVYYVPYDMEFQVDESAIKSIVTHSEA